jgi:hypothetical protein
MCVWGIELIHGHDHLRRRLHTTVDIYETYSFIHESMYANTCMYVFCSILAVNTSSCVHTHMYIHMHTYIDDKSLVQVQVQVLLDDPITDGK